MFKHDCQTIREYGYKSCIPYYIMFDQDLNANHLRLYTLIEQMESNPNPKVSPTFSYAWFAQIIGVERREAMRIAKVMKDKNYISHKQKQDGRWVWAIVKSEVICDDGGVASNDTGGVSDNATGGVASNDTLNTNKINNYKEKTTTTVIPDLISSFFTPKQEAELLAFRIARDKRSDPLFLKHCQHHIENQKNDIGKFQRIAGLKVILGKHIDLNEPFMARGFVDVETQKIKAEQETTRLRLQEEAQDLLHAQKMATMKQENIVERAGNGANKLADMLKGFLNANTTRMQEQAV